MISPRMVNWPGVGLVLGGVLIGSVVVGAIVGEAAGEVGVAALDDDGQGWEVVVVVDGGGKLGVVIGC